LLVLKVNNLKATNDKIAKLAQDLGIRDVAARGRGSRRYRALPWSEFVEAQTRRSTSPNGETSRSTPVSVGDICPFEPGRRLDALFSFAAFTFQQTRFCSPLTIKSAPKIN